MADAVTWMRRLGWGLLALAFWPLTLIWLGTWWQYRYKDRVPLLRFLWVPVLAWWPAFVVCGLLIWLMLQTIR